MKALKRCYLRLVNLLKPNRFTLLNRTIEESKSRVEGVLLQLKKNDELTKANLSVLLEELLTSYCQLRHFCVETLQADSRYLNRYQIELFIKEISCALRYQLVKSLSNYEYEIAELTELLYKRYSSSARAKFKLHGMHTMRDLVIHYQFAENKSKWYICDLEVDGVSILKTKQTEIKRLINSLGINGAIKMLRIQNNGVG